MGWAYLPEPGEKGYGGRELLCKGKCDHIDCNAIRTDAARLCKLCGKPIGLGSKYYGLGDEMRHAVCEWVQVEREQSQPVKPCVTCGRPALDGHLTCGSVGCGEAAARDRERGGS